MKVNLHKPTVHRDDKPGDILGRLVHVRPYYSVPTGRGSSQPARSPFTQRARVTEEFGEEMVIVHFASEAYHAPWAPRAAYFPRELHTLTCECPACEGEGIASLRGA